ncbi:hypothetical protein LJB88_02480 [Erysipelotrichaceae bacterium OttesenSCG-928-M19]|nr:hypothetical protein [Erysipelotrichaceae bacterium OttesenSCG-928-M19]
MKNLVKREAYAIEAIMNHIDGFDNVHRGDFEKRKQSLNDLEAVANQHAQEMKLMNDISQRMIKLNNDLDKLEDSDNRLKVYYEQRKALHEIKHLLKDFNTNEQYDEIELIAIEKLLSE